MDDLSDQLDINASMISPDQCLPVVRGEIEYRTAPTLRAAIDAALDGSVRGLTVDLADVGFIDSSGLSVLIDARTQTSIQLRHPSPAAERVIAMTGLSSTLQIEPA